MNILILSYQGGIAGSTYSVSRLARGLSERGHQVFVGCPPGLLLPSLLEGSTVQHIPMTFSSKFDLANMRHIRDLVRRYTIDVVNAQASKDRYTSVFARLLYRLPVKLVHTRRQIPASMGGFLQRLIYYNGTDRIIAVSEGVKQALVKKGLPAHHIAVIHNGTPREKYSSLNPEATNLLRQRYGIAQGDLVIGCVSRRKRQEQLLQALPLLSRPATVIMVGLDEQPAYAPLLAQLEGRHRVIFTGMTPPAEVLNHYALFHVKVLPSVTEGLSQAILEAMALGVPVVATHAGGNPEVIADGINGFTFKDGDIAGLATHIERLCSDEALRQRLVAAAKITALEDFSIEKTVARHEALFLSLLSPEVGRDLPPHLRVPL